MHFARTIRCTHRASREAIDGTAPHRPTAALRLQHRQRDEDRGAPPRRGHHRPRHGQPGPADASAHRRQAGPGGAERPQPPLLGLARHHQAAPRAERLVRAPLRRRRSTPSARRSSRIGAKEGLAHLMWVLLRSGDTALVPEPSYPIHQFSCIFAGAEVSSVPLTHDTADFFADLTVAYQRTWPRPRVILVSFPHNPTGHCVELDFFERLVHFAREERRARRPRLRLRRDRLRRLQAAEHPPGAGRQGRGRRVRLAQQEPQHVRLAPGLLRPATRRSSPACSASRATSTTASSSPSRSPPSPRSTTATTCPRRSPSVYEHRRDVLCDGLERIGWHVHKPTRHDVRLGADPGGLPCARFARVQQARC